MRYLTGNFALALGLLLAIGHCHGLTMRGLPPGTLPRWPATYNMSRSTIIEPCSDSTKQFDPSVCAAYGICDYDWSNQKPLWSQAKPMNCSETLVEQARATKAVNNETKVMVYRNLVKALPWFTQVREKLEDSRYWGFFLRKATPTGDDATGQLYHDFEQTPRGDCGKGVECGEYLWNHTNGSMLTKFFVDTFIGGDQGMASPFIDGFFIDDGWSASGPSEENKNAVNQTGMSPADVAAMTKAWSANMAAAQTAIINAGGSIQFNSQILYIFETSKSILATRLHT